MSELVTVIQFGELPITMPMWLVVVVAFYLIGRAL